MAMSRLPSQTVRRLYVGPNGIIISQDDPERDLTREPSRRWQNAAAWRQKRRQEAMYGFSDDESDADANEVSDSTSGVVAKLRQQVQCSEAGMSSTRCDITNRLAEKLASAQIAARRLASPVVVDLLDDQMQCDVLASLPIEAMASAAQTCKLWSNLLSTNMGESIWERLVISAPIHMAAACAISSSSPLPSTMSSSSAKHLYWQAVGRRLQQESVALQRRWRTGACKVLSTGSNAAE